MHEIKRQKEELPIISKADLLVPISYNPEKHKIINKKCLAGIPVGTTWEDTIKRPGYKPNDLDLKKDPDSKVYTNSPFISYEKYILRDAQNRPLNPKGPTNKEGRGVLWYWGPNMAVDSIITKIKNGKLWIVIVKRVEGGENSVPGGFLNEGETPQHAVERETYEEVSVRQDFSIAHVIYQGYVDDPRNTDQAWIEVDTFHLHLEDGNDIEIRGGDDAQQEGTGWKELTDDLINNLYASHPDVVRMAIYKWQKETGLVVGKDGSVGFLAK